MAGITTGAGKSIVSKMHIIDNIVCSDHKPLCIEIECDIVPICNSTFIKEPRDVCKWNLDKEKLNYKTCTNELFSDIIIPVDALLCNNAYCIEHVTDIDNFYTCIINGIQSAEKNVFHLNQLVKFITQSLVGTSMLRIIKLWLEMHSGCGISMGDPTKANYTTV